MSVNSQNWLVRCLEKLPSTRIGVFGDFCLDAYWLIDPDQSELSVETHLPVRRVRQQHYSLGGAANIVANLVDLGIKQVHAVGLVGDDLFGRVVLDMLGKIGVSTQSMLNSQADWQTMVFAKPYLGDEEQNRIDFGGANVLADASIQALATELDSLAQRVDVIILNQQVPAGLSTAQMIKQINRVIAAHPQCKFIVDSRDRTELYQGPMIKLNAHEASRLAGQPQALDERISADHARNYATKLFKRFGQPIFLTRGQNGIVVVDKQGLREVPGIQVVEQIDSVGAGDAAMSALAAVIGSGGDCLTAAKVANLAASVTVRKIKTTGTATPEEILQLGPNPDYVYLPELADDPRQAQYLANSEIEIIRELPAKMNIQHAIFDHDGTLSTLRQGWEQIMEPMMVRAILGTQYEAADQALYYKAVDHVRRYVDKTTGVQTLVQMQGLLELVKQFGCVPKKLILDIHGYKAVYNKELLAMVHLRMEKLKRGELDVLDFQIKNARPLLEKLFAKGIKLYLASGTDVQDTLAEAEVLGYAHLFEGRIFGAVGDVNVEAKKMVLQQIIRQHKLNGPELVTFGDGPVEIRQTRKRAGIAVGLASDEVRRFGLNPAKRARLIRAGADLIVPDFSQLDELLAKLRCL